MASLATKITPDLFTPSKFYSAQDKCKRVRALVRFVESGYAESKFTKAAYDCCYLSFDFIAHYDRDGFWEHYFGEGTGADARGVAEFNDELRRDARRRAMLDTDRNSDMAALFAEGGMLAHLIGN